MAYSQMDRSLFDGFVMQDIEDDPQQEKEDDNESVTLWSDDGGDELLRDIELEPEPESEEEPEGEPEPELGEGEEEVEEPEPNMDYLTCNKCQYPYELSDVNDYNLCKDCRRQAFLYDHE